MSQFQFVPEIANAILCLRDADAAFRAQYPLTDDNQWVNAPPDRLCEVVGRIGEARAHLETLAEYGSASYVVAPLQPTESAEIALADIEMSRDELSEIEKAIRTGPEYFLVFAEHANAWAVKNPLSVRGVPDQFCRQLRARALQIAEERNAK